VLVLQLASVSVTGWISELRWELVWGWLLAWVKDQASGLSLEWVFELVQGTPLARLLVLV
jgi:hypothetical protein